MNALISDLIEFLSIESTTGKELLAAKWLAEYLTGFGWKAQLNEVEANRYNILVIGSSMHLLFCSHTDTVPPFISPKVNEEKTQVIGRGSSDAKGVILAQIHAANELVKQGIYSKEEIGFAYVVGEEVDHVGAIQAAKDLRQYSIPHIIIGEPTQNKLSQGAMGLLKLEIKIKGLFGHSAFVESGRSANHELIELLYQIKDTCGSDPNGILGETMVNIGIIQGGVASNVFSPSAKSLILYRLAESSDSVLNKLDQLMEKFAPNGSINILSRFEPMEFDVITEIETTIAKFNSDASYFIKQGTKLYLFGPGDIQVAHSDNENITFESLIKGIETYFHVAKRLK